MSYVALDGDLSRHGICNASRASLAIFMIAALRSSQPALIPSTNPSTMATAILTPAAIICAIYSSMAVSIPSRIIRIVSPACRRRSGKPSEMPSINSSMISKPAATTSAMLSPMPLRRAKRTSYPAWSKSGRPSARASIIAVTKARIFDKISGKNSGSISAPSIAKIIFCNAPMISGVFSAITVMKLTMASAKAAANPGSTSIMAAPTIFMAAAIGIAAPAIATRPSAAMNKPAPNIRAPRPIKAMAMPNPINIGTTGAIT